ncbi:hypothetical protein GCM10010832_13520 [Psychroflexus planctonicus]|uniref:Por secretion system C-terminal sorting domain-containing protein n=2 Tax=Psychroflexus planctonicus TaxID=1526575 RepID=A0ABQ1SET1_9FLAO|nr:hypothetical protein GCM10010832_13520 [Psychroflexus planctonicus]
MFAQDDVCGTENDTNEPLINTNNSSTYSFSSDESFLNTFPQRNMNIAIWGIEKTDGVQSISQADAHAMVEYLNAEFNQFNICFNLVHFSHIVSDQHFDTTASVVNQLFYTEPAVEYAGTAIRVMVPHHIQWRGVAYGHDRLIVRADQEEIIGIFIHEIGHNLSLKHTHEYFDSSWLCENVTRDPNDPAYNAESAGDYVVDTQASPNFYTYMQYVSQDCNNYTGNLINNCDGVPYNITLNEIQNYMAYTRQHCRTLFTTGQKIRMHEYISNEANDKYINILDDIDYDLYSVNSILDKGAEPDNQTGVIWDSPDIWVRNQPDGLTIQEHQDLEYNDDNTPVYVYVRVKNKSCNPSSEDDTLKLYWAKGGIGEQTWPYLWEGDYNESNALDVGGEIGSQTIPVLGQEDEAILEFEWQPKSPSVYEDAGFTNKPWMFCFLSRIESTTDVMTFPEESPSDAAVNARNNNNIVYKNTTTLVIEGTSDIGSISAGNYSELVAVTSDINFFTDQGNAIWQEAELRVRLDDKLWNAWLNSGAQSTNTRIWNSAEREILINGNNSSLDNISFAPVEWGTLTPRVNFLIKEVTGETYTLHISQTESNTNYVLGGYTYHINRNSSRQFFSAEASLDNTQNLTHLEAEHINELAVYNWYDAEGNFISSGQTLTITNIELKEYTLEVIANSDGHKDYKNFTVKENRSISSISPNPTLNDFSVNYNTGSATNAFLVITNVISGVSDNYLLDISKTYKTININNKPTGQYIVSLVTNNIIVDTKQLIKN